MTSGKSGHASLLRVAVVGLAATVALGVGTSPGAPAGTSVTALSITKYVDKASP